ncbi:MAG: IMP cyclohydrolase, partial [Pseudomonadota bacterium]
LKTGNPDLLVYPAIICGSGIAVSNGKQTEDVFKFLSSTASPAEILLKSQSSWEYEPDAPNFTPRISGCIARGAGLSVLKRAADGTVQRNFFEIPLIPGRGKMLATYTGANENPLPSFSGEPLDVDLPWASAEEAAQALYEALGPEPGGSDFRVAAACVFADAGKTVTLKVKNRHI